MLSRVHTRKQGKGKRDGSKGHRTVGPLVEPKKNVEVKLGLLGFPIRFPFRLQIEGSILQSQQEQKSKKVLYL